VKNRITEEDIGKLYKRTFHDTAARYLRIKEYDRASDTYLCDAVRDGSDIARSIVQVNVDIYCYEEVCELEVLVVCGVEI
jgi:hypothetical protein